MSATPHLVDLSAYLATPSEAELEFRRLFPAAAPRVIMDIGACEGEDSIRFTRLYPQAKVFAFEPLPSNQTLVRANLARYDAKRVELVPLALSNQQGEATFHVSSGRPPDLFAGKDWNYGNKSSSLLAPAGDGKIHGWVEFKEAITVPTGTLDQFCAERGIDRIDFIQMDVQGAELLVLAGAERMLPHLTAIWLEVSSRKIYQDQVLDHEITRFLRARGFALAHEIYLADDVGEGDHLYVNTRQARVWPYLLAQRTRAGLRRLRRVAGKVKHALLRSS